MADSDQRCPSPWSWEDTERWLLADPEKAVSARARYFDAKPDAAAHCFALAAPLMSALDRRPGRLGSFIADKPA